MYSGSHTESSVVNIVPIVISTTFFLKRYVLEANSFDCLVRVPRKDRSPCKFLNCNKILIFSFETIKKFISVDFIFGGGN